MMFRTVLVVNTVLLVYTVAFCCHCLCLVFRFSVFSSRFLLLFLSLFFLGLWFRFSLCSLCLFSLFFLSLSLFSFSLVSLFLSMEPSMDNKSVSLFRSAYAGPYRSVTPVVGPSMAKQSFKGECDINQIMARYMATGILPETVEGRQAQFLDCTDLDFQAAMDVVAGARELFDRMPSAVRERFANDPARLLEFVNDEGNRAEAIKLGLVVEAPAAPPEAPVVSPEEGG